MPEEVGNLINSLNQIKEQNFGDLKIYSGLWKILNEKKIYLSIACSGWGKVSAARATSRLLSVEYLENKVEFMIFSGVAGAVKSDLKQWDIVLAESLIQHDMDTSPIYKKYFIPALDKTKIYSQKKILDNTFEYIHAQKINNRLTEFGNIYKGLIATGDSFVSNSNQMDELKNAFPDIYAVEMEGAAFGQVCTQEKIDWIVIRVISDSANEEASVDFKDFLKSYKEVSWKLIEITLEAIKGIIL